MKTNHVDEYVSSGTSPTARSKASKINEVVPFHHTPIDPFQILTLAEHFVETGLIKKSEGKFVLPKLVNTHVN